MVMVNVRTEKKADAMVRFFAQCIDNGFMLIAAAILLRYYFKPEAKRLYKKKWVLAGCIIMILYSVIEFGLAYREYIRAQLPSGASLEKTIQDSGRLVSEDFMFSSVDGYQILIPSGYTYISSQTGGLSLTATKDYSAFVVVKMQASAGLDSSIDDTLVAMQKRHSTFRLNDRRKISIRGSEAVRIDCSVTKNDVPAALILVLCRKGNTQFQLTFSCPQNSFAELKPQYEEILKSFQMN